MVVVKDRLHVVMAPGKFSVGNEASYDAFVKAYHLGAHVVGHTEMYEKHTRDAFVAACHDSGYRPVQPLNDSDKPSSTAIAVRKDSPFKLVGMGYDFSIPNRSQDLPGAGVGHSERGIVKVTLDVSRRNFTFGAMHFVTGFDKHPITTREYYEQVDSAVRFVRTNARRSDMAMLGADPNYRVSDPTTSNHPDEVFDKAGLVSVFEGTSGDNTGRRTCDIYRFANDKRLEVVRTRVHAPKPYAFDHKPRSVWVDIPRMRG